ncbi:BA75_03323T0 [Komagataella pastoris]|uniref:BA75_03323T0 n=1 Tax=Komagataella pastoris TaxID=4922 RepID=A0A1B2JB20_PICPA|nr:BA75_03323T0 [Komagataella pastoris]
MLSPTGLATVNIGLFYATTIAQSFCRRPVSISVEIVELSLSGESSTSTDEPTDDDEESITIDNHTSETVTTSNVVKHQFLVLGSIMELLLLAASILQFLLSCG